MVDLSSYEAARDWLYSLKNVGPRYGIDRMERLAALLGQPQRSYPCIHVAGTNGKGSTCAMLEAVLRDRGLKVGLATSPHLVRQGERIQVDRRILEEERIFQYVRELLPLAQEIARADPELHPSFFEFMTAIAFVHFQREQVDAAVVEVGLGGRLDATNVLDPELAIVSSIGLDHCEILGDTLEQIAREKAGIIKPGKPVVIGMLPPEAEREIERICAERGCALFKVSDRFGSDLAAYPETRLKGGYQRINAGIALLAAEVLQARFGLDLARARAAIRDARWPGRWEEATLPSGRKIVFDVSHNPEGARWLDENLARLVAESGGARPDVVMGVLGADRAASLVPTAAKWARSLTFVQPQQPRACSFETLEGLVPRSFSGPVRRSRVDTIFPSRGVCALDEAIENPLVVTGSIYLIGEIWDRFLEEAPLGQGALQDF